MSIQLNADELERDITLMHQELITKRALLNESRQKFQKEITEHNNTKSSLSKQLNENKQLQTQLEVSLKATQKLEEENKKNLELLVNLQVQVDAYQNERQKFVDECYKLRIENNSLKNEITDWKERLKGHLSFQENYKSRQLENAKLVDEILSKQEILNKEQNRLEIICKEGLNFASKVSEEVTFQAKFVQAANESQRKMEEEIIRLLAALKELKDKAEKNSESVPQEKNQNYMEEWKSYEQNSKMRTAELLEENKKLKEELNFATTQIELLLKNYDDVAVAT